MSELLSPAELARRAAVTANTARLWVRQGLVPATGEGHGQIRIDTADLPWLPEGDVLRAPGEAARLLGVPETRLRRLGDDGAVASVVLPSGHRRYPARALAACAEPAPVPALGGLEGWQVYRSGQCVTVRHQACRAVVVRQPHVALGVILAAVARHSCAGAGTGIVPFPGAGGAGPCSAPAHPSGAAAGGDR